MPNGEEGFIEKGKKFVNDLVQKILPIPSPDAAVHNNLAKNKTKKATLKVLVGTLVAEGNPRLKANEVVTVENVAKRHSGNWLVEKVTHDIAVGSTYQCTLELAKNGTQKATGKNNKTAAKVNKSQGPTKIESKKPVKVVYVGVNNTGPERTK